MPCHRNYRNNRILHCRDHRVLFQRIPSMGDHHFLQWEKQPMQLRRGMSSTNNHDQSTLARHPDQCGMCIYLSENLRRITSVPLKHVEIDDSISFSYRWNRKIHEDCNYLDRQHWLLTSMFPELQLQSNRISSLSFSVCLFVFEWWRVTLKKQISEKLCIFLTITFISVPIYSRKNELPRQDMISKYQQQHSSDNVQR